MKAAVYKERGKIVLEERPRPSLERDTDAIVKVTLAAICSSDLHIKHGAVPAAVPGTILGHEFVGVVAETGGAVTGVRPGDRVAVNVETFCGKCYFCARGYVNNCTDPLGGWALGCRIDGGQAEYVRVPHAEQGLNKIPDTVTDEQALFTGDLLSTGYWAADLAQIGEGDTVAVIGAGPAGLCACLCAALKRPGRILLLDRDPQRLSFAERHNMADVTLCPASPQQAEHVIKGMTGGRGADAVIEAAGGEDTFETAWRIARPNGVVAVVAMYEQDQILPLPAMYGKNLIFKTGGVDAARCGEILELIAAGRLDASPLITHRYGLSQILEAYDVFENRRDGVMKCAIVPGR